MRTPEKRGSASLLIRVVLRIFRSSENYATTRYIRIARYHDTRTHRLDLVTLSVRFRERQRRVSAAYLAASGHRYARSAPLRSARETRACIFDRVADSAGNRDIFAARLRK